VRSFDSASRAQARIKGKHAWPHTEVRVELSGLVPGGVYSHFYATFGFDSRHPLCPAAERSSRWRRAPETKPPIPRRSSRTPPGGPFFGQGERAPPRRAQVLYSVVYDFDGLTYHLLPNRGEHVTQGNDAMRQPTVWQKL
jgi:hypothetical protein